ncbi:MAG: GDSL-type esterase/lipase family protein [Verrucomicrobiales bacterium]
MRTILFAGFLACLMQNAIFAQTAAAEAPPAKPPSITPVPRDAGWMKRHEKFNALAEEGRFDVLFIGDSITQGWEGAGKASWEKHIAPMKAANFGIGGDRTEHVLWRLENGNLKGKLKPKVIVVMIGTNNTGANNPPDQIAMGVEAIVKKLTARFPDATVAILGIFPRSEKPDDPKRINNVKANELIAKLADGKKVVYTDEIGQAFLKPDGTLGKDIMPDLLHLSPAGYEIWGKLMEEKIPEWKRLK